LFCLAVLAASLSFFGVLCECNVVDSECLRLIVIDETIMNTGTHFQFRASVWYLELMKLQ